MGGRAIRIYLAEGTPNGLRTAEIGLSTCKAVMAPRVALDALSRRSEARRTGVYVLIGDDEQHAARRAVYVGEGDDVFARIRRHEEEKAFWEHVVLFVSKDENLTKGHVRFLEARLIQIATGARRATVKNGTAPDPPGLPEADVAEMEEFLEQARMLASVLGVTVFETADASSSATKVAPKEPVLTLSGDGFKARGVIHQGQIVVLKGSVARHKEAPSLSVSSRALRAELLDAGVLEKAPAGLSFSQDYAFDSASGAAQVINGANVNGRTAWKLSDGRTFQQWQDEQLPDTTTRVPDRG